MAASDSIAFSPTSFNKPFLSCVGSERVATMLRKDYWERFDEVQSVLGFEYIRCHGLLCDDMGLCRIDEWEGNKRLFLNFSYIDEAFDAMLEHGVRPFVELGFMPTALAAGTQTVFWWKGNVTPPADWEMWAELIRGLCRHWIGRYGLDEVRRWPMEVWNEPNLVNFWEGADQGAYFRLYEVSVAAIKSVDAGIRVGGPAICGGADHWIDDFLGFVRKHDLPLDFFSRHLYTGLTPTKRTPELFYQFQSPPESPIDELREVRSRIDRAGFPELELHITEFNTSYHPLCPVHDTPFNAAYLARLLSESGDLVKTLSYWTFCDLFEEADIPRSLFYGGFGLVARCGIPKPSFHLFAFFKKLGDRVMLRTESALATSRADGSLALVAWNPVMKAETQAPKPMSLDLPWAGGPALVRRSRVHEAAANPWGTWIALGRPRFPDRATIDFLRDASRPACETAVIQPAGGQLRVAFNLERNEVCLLEIMPFVDESGSYLGLDDSLIDGYGPALYTRP